jgi:hypothetical protein
VHLSLGSPGVTQAIDEFIRADLQDCRDSYFWWLIFSSTAVAVGVVLEGPEVVYETVGVYRCRFRKTGPEQQERRAPDWITLLALLGWILVASGVAGEGIAEGYVSWADGTVQTFNDIIAADARRQTAFALERAAGAYKRATEAEADTADAEASASLAGQRAAEANRAAEEERLARIKIEASVAWRRLTDDQIKAIGNSLIRFAGTSTGLEYNVGDSEADNFGRGISAALTLAHWGVSDPLPQEVFADLQRREERRL